MRRDELVLSTAARNVATDMVSRTAMAAAGQAVLGTVGAFVLPGAGAIVFPVVGAYAGVTQGGKLSNRVKRQLAKREEMALGEALKDLIERMQEVLIVKEEIRGRKWQQLKVRLPEGVHMAFAKEHRERMQLLENVRKELTAIHRTVEESPATAFERILKVLGKSGIHVYTLRAELEQVEAAMVAYGRKL